MEKGFEDHDGLESGLRGSCNVDYIIPVKMLQTKL